MIIKADMIRRIMLAVSLSATAISAGGCGFIPPTRITQAYEHKQIMSRTQALDEFLAIGKESMAPYVVEPKPPRYIEAPLSVDELGFTYREKRLANWSREYMPGVGSRTWEQYYYVDQRFLFSNVSGIWLDYYGSTICVRLKNEGGKEIYGFFFDRNRIKEDRIPAFLSSLLTLCLNVK